MQSIFQKSLEFTLRWEGGMSSTPRDTAARQRLPGEIIHTNQGVTQGAYNRFREIEGVNRRPVRLMTDLERDEIYKRQYWTPANCDVMPFELAVCVFDLAVNSGVGRARECVDAMHRKGFGVKSLGAAEFMIDWRANWFNAIIKFNPSQTVFKRGWFNRLKALKDLIGYGKPRV
jgi:lysozyme family protein